MGDRTFTHKTEENAKPKATPCKLFTGRGFYLASTYEGERKSAPEI